MTTETAKQFSDDDRNQLELYIRMVGNTRTVEAVRHLLADHDELKRAYEERGHTIQSYSLTIADLSAEREVQDRELRSLKKENIAYRQSNEALRRDNHDFKEDHLAMVEEIRQLKQEKAGGVTININGSTPENLNDLVGKFTDLLKKAL